MLTRLRVKNFRALRDVDIALGPFQVFVGPNGSGKSTLLDVLVFLRDCVNGAQVSDAVKRRGVGTVDELTYAGRGGDISIELELQLDDQGPSRDGWRARYLLELRSEPAQPVAIVREWLGVCPPDRGWDDCARESGAVALIDRGSDREGEIALLNETHSEPGRSSVGVYDLPGYMYTYGPDESALARLPPDRKRFPTANAIRTILGKGLTLLDPNAAAMRKPCSAMDPEELLPDGRNLARVARRLLAPGGNGHDFDPAAAKADWIAHLQLALPDLEDICWAQREDDRAEYLKVRFAGGIECPSGSLSEGTLRMLALTLPAFLPAHRTVYLVEEPENAVHPHALEIILSALRAIPVAQVLVTTHSPLLVDLVGKEALLVFSKKEGQVMVQAGSRHPALVEWDGRPRLSSLLSAGYL
jgi:predicted ATPase